MSHHTKAPLCRHSGQEQYELTQICRSPVIPAVEVIRTKIVLAVTRSHDYQSAARAVGRRSGDAVSHLVARSNAEGTVVQTGRRRLGSN